MIEKTDAKSQMGLFNEALAKWKESGDVIPESAEPKFQACGFITLPDQERMTIDTVYCDGKYHYVKTAKERSYKSDGETITYTPKTPIFTMKEKCSIPIAKKHDIYIQQIKTQYSKMLFETFDSSLQPKAFAVCQAFNGEGKLILGGNTGLGKTHLARATYVNLIQNMKEPIWFKAPDLAELFRRIQTFNNDWKDHTQALELYERATKKVECVFIDDLGAERITESELFSEQFKIFLESIQKGIFITTNLNSSAILERYGEKITSRLFENAKTVVMQGQDYRKRSFPNTKI